jgi:hypothetical protein
MIRLTEKFGLGVVTRVYVLKRSVCLAPYVGDWRLVRLSTLI